MVTNLIYLVNLGDMWQTLMMVNWNWVIGICVCMMAFLHQVLGRPSTWPLRGHFVFTLVSNFKFSKCWAFQPWSWIKKRVSIWFNFFQDVWGTISYHRPQLSCFTLKAMVSLNAERDPSKSSRLILTAASFPTNMYNLKYV